MSSSNDGNHQNGSSGSSNGNPNKRPLTLSEILDEKTKRFKRTTSANEVSLGPKYPVTPDSLVLKSRYPINKNDAWNNETNPDGVVPIVVHPDLVKGSNSCMEDQKEMTADQKEGLQFLWDCYENGQGGILAHEMGLGKTRTGITFVVTLLEQSMNSKKISTPGIKKCVIIAPKNAVPVWEVEFTKWVPVGIPCKVVTVMPRDKDGWKKVDDFMEPNSEKNVLITSYESFIKYNSTFKDRGFDKKEEIGLVICDEAHVLKNPMTLRVQNLSKFSVAKMWVGITGTPYQNSLEELCQLVGFFRRDIFGSGEINELCKPINNALKTSRKLGDAEKRLLVEIRNKIVPSALHVKKNSWNMEKHEIVLCVPLAGNPHFGSRSPKKYDDVTGAQHRMYESVTKSLGQIEEEKISFFEKLSYLQKACIHPTTLYEALHKYPDIFSEAIDVYDKCFPKEQREVPKNKKRMPVFSAKIDAVSTMAKKLMEDFPEEKEKMIIVSSSTVLLKFIEQYFDEILETKALMYDGETSEYTRAQNLELFQKDDKFKFLLLSLKAGGTALTLTRANHLVLMDPDYNPANDRQAIARIYRPSQNKPAYIYRMMSTGTLEEIKLIRQLDKEDMRQVFEPEGSTNVRSLFNECDLLEYEPKKRSTLKDLLDKMEKESFTNEEFDITLADELRESHHYTEARQVPDYLRLVREAWNENHFSFAYHTSWPQEMTQRCVLDETCDIDTVEAI